MKRLNFYFVLTIIFLALTYLTYKFKETNSSFILFIFVTGILLYIIVYHPSVKDKLAQYGISGSFLESIFYWDIVFIPYAFFLIARDVSYPHLMYYFGLIAALAVLVLFFYKFITRPETKRDLILCILFDLLGIGLFIMKLR